MGLVYNKCNVTVPVCHYLFLDSGCKMSGYPFNFMGMKGNLVNVARAMKF